MTSASIGFFDSGVGGLTVLRAVNDLLPRYPTVYLGDHANGPYGTRSQEEIFQFTKSGVEYLFSKGCPLVILACNSASAQALRRIQQRFLPTRFPNNRVLGVVRPGGEVLNSETRAGHVGVFGTAATIHSHAYERELRDLKSDTSVTEIACSTLASAVEAGEEREDKATEEIRLACEKLLVADPMIDAALLACTHFAFVSDLFRSNLPGVQVITQEEVIAQKLADYLDRHSEIASRLDESGTHRYYTTGDTKLVSQRASRFFGEDVTFLNT